MTKTKEITEGTIKYGRGVVSNGYRALHKPRWHNANSNGYVKLHRYKYELISGLRLNPKQIVHHKDGNKLNNMYYNLEVMSNVEHSKMTWFGRNDAIKRACRQEYMKAWVQITELVERFGLDRDTVSKYVDDLKPIRRQVLYQQFLKLKRKGCGTFKACRQLEIPIGTIYHMEGLWKEDYGAHKRTTENQGVS